MRVVSFIISMFFALTASAQFVLTPKTPIEPLIKCQWRQGNPFYYNTPIHKSWVTHYMAGCGTAALAQVMYYYKNPGCDALPAYSAGLEEIDALPATTFNWDLILSYYECTNTAYDTDIDILNKELTVEQKEVAKLYQYVASAIKVEYKEDNMAVTSMQLDDFIKPLGFSEEKSYCTAKISDKELEEIFDRELEQGRPVIVRGDDKDYRNGHFFVVDGRDDTGRYHVNDGGSVGYFIMSKEMLMSGEEGVYHHLTNTKCIVPVMPDGWVIPTYSTSIKTPTTINDGVVYNLQGQKVGNSLEGLSRGIYIKGGKKFIIK